MPDRAPSSVRVPVPRAAVDWAAAHDVSVSELAARLLEFSASVLPEVGVAPRRVPAVNELHVAAVLPRAAAAVVFGVPPEVPPFPGVPPDEVERARSRLSFDECPRLRRRLRAYARSCILLFPAIGADQLAYIVAGYAAACGVDRLELVSLVQSVLRLPPPIGPGAPLS